MGVTDDLFSLLLDVPCQPSSIRFIRSTLGSTELTSARTRTFKANATQSFLPDLTWPDYLPNYMSLVPQASATMSRFSNLSLPVVVL